MKSVMASVLVAVAGLSGCVGNADLGNEEGSVLTGADETQGSISSELSAGVPIGSTLQTTAGLNLRTGPGTSYNVRLVIPNGGQVTTVNTATPTSGWYNVKYNGVTGWASGTYLKLISSPGGSGGGGGSGGSLTSANVEGSVLRAKSGVGATYWWGHGRWYPNQSGGSNAGSCSGSCPNCSHSGSTGADCSGYVAKLWQVPSSNTSLTTDSHPYSTVSFNGSNSQWRTVSRGSVVRGDALVYNTNGAGHIFLYESGDGWGSMWAYEARGCSYGIVHNLRTASSSFKGIRHY